MADALVVLTWHAVDRTWEYPCRPGAGVRGLARQLAWLRRVANVVPLEPALDDLQQCRPLPPRAVALTFDDGYRDNLELGAPLLQRTGLPATFFLVPGFLSGEVRPWWEVLGWAFANSARTSLEWSGRTLPIRGRAGRRSLGWVKEQLKGFDQAARERATAELVELLQPRGTLDCSRLLLDWAGARDLVRRGFSVGSHSLRHAILGNEAGRQAADLAAARQRLEEELGVAVRLLAYPNGTPGDYDAGTVAAAERAGHTHSLTVRPGLNRPSTPVHEARRVVVNSAHGLGGSFVRRAAAALRHAAGRRPR